MATGTAYAAKVTPAMRSRGSHWARYAGNHCAGGNSVRHQLTGPDNTPPAMELSAMVSVPFWHEPPAPQWRLVVILMLGGARGHGHLLPGRLVVRDQTEE